MLAASPGLPPYGLRHGYAWRGHKGYVRSIPVRDLAALMGHNPATHHRHYGKWTDEAGLEEAVAKAVGPSRATSAAAFAAEFRRQRFCQQEIDPL
jgi:integrase